MCCDVAVFMRVHIEKDQGANERQKGVAAFRSDPSDQPLCRSLRGIACAIIFILPILGCHPELSESFDAGIRVGRIEGEKLDEISGIVVSRRFPGVLWVHNDGQKGGFYAVRTNGQIVARFQLTVGVEDLEDIAIGPGAGGTSNYLYLGDIGDNGGNRDFIRIYRFPEPELNQQRDSDKRIKIHNPETLTLRYPGVPRDAEALLIDPLDGDVLIVAKLRWRAEIYRAAAKHWSTEAVVGLERIAEVAFGGVSGGDISSDGTMWVLRREDAARLWSRPSKMSVADVFRRRSVAVSVIGPPREANGESIAFEPVGSGYYTIGEGRGEAIYFFPLRRAE